MNQSNWHKVFYIDSEIFVTDFHDIELGKKFLIVILLIQPENVSYSFLLSTFCKRKKKLSVRFPHCKEQQESRVCLCYAIKLTHHKW